MAAENNTNNPNSNKRKRYLPHSNCSKNGSDPLSPGVQGFFITCDGGRERQASTEAINIIHTFYEELVEGEDSGGKHADMPKILNKIITSSDFEASCDNDESAQLIEEDANNKNQANGVGGDTSIDKQYLETGAEQKEEAQLKETVAKQDVDATPEDQSLESETSAKKQRLETSAASEDVVNEEPKKKPIDKLIEDEVKELKDHSKRRFVSLDSGCNGIVFVQMHRSDGDPGPAEIVKHMMTSAAATRKHMSRFILRILPVQLTCYASQEEISKAVKPLIDQHFPAEAETPLKFAVVYDVRANTGIDRMAVIKAVADCVPAPHKVDLNSPDKSIIVQISKTICSIGVAEKYKELSKYNLRQLTSPKQ